MKELYEENCFFSSIIAFSNKTFIDLTSFKENMVLFLPYHSLDFCNIFNNKSFTDPIEDIMGEGSIIYAFTSSSMPPKGNNFSSRIHVDSPRIIKDYITNLGVMILLSDFTVENGATQFFPNSHNLYSPPSELDFNLNSKYLIAKAGSVCYFNARTWHRGGDNNSDYFRHAITCNIVRPWMKQRMDYTKIINKKKLQEYSSKIIQKLGFNASIPQSFKEYYQPISKRGYNQKHE